MQFKKTTHKTVFLISFLFLNWTTDIFAHDEENKKPSDWNPISAGPVTTWTSPLCGKGKFVFQPFFFYNRTRGAFNTEGNYNSLAVDDRKYQFQQQLFMQYGLTEKLEVDAQAVYQQNFIKQGSQKAHSRGWGDSYLFLRYCLTEEGNTLPHIVGLFQLKLPTGKYQKLDPGRLGTDSMGATSGGGSYDFGFGLNFTKKLKPFILHLDTIYSFPQEIKVDGSTTRYGDYLNYDFGIEYFLPKGFNFMLEINGFLQPDKQQNGNKVSSSDINYLTGALGIGWSNDRIQTLLAYQRTLTGTNVDANDSVVLALVYTF